ncbi:MAG: FKBP-type peptidyl-prolyl cis-trans isomerase [Bacteroidales bacterium]|nr:FKBP-type peptidyl-prolyl cis-trans isomerase [Bacteroidales bacterium]
MTGNVKIKTDLDTLSYALGADIGNSLKNISIDEINYDVFLNGLSDVLEENELKVDEEKIKPFINNYITKLKEEKSAKNLAEGKAFLEENKKKDGIIVTESGLQYEIITEGTGKSPSETDVVVCNYHGTLIDGTVFDSSVDRGEPATFQVGGVIAGWTEALQLMKEGSKWKLYIPSDLAYGDRQRSELIKANSTLIFEVELIDVK